MRTLADRPFAGFWRRGAALIYEALLSSGVVFVAGYLFIALARDAQSGLPRFVFQIYLFAVCGAYFVFCWVRSGQTLAMKTWGLRVICKDGSALRPGRAFLRYVLAIFSIGTGIGLLWAFLDPERQFLHDRLAGTRIVIAEPKTSGTDTEHRLSVPR